MAGSWDVARYESGHSYVWEYGSSLVKLLAPQPGERILDLGCGAGQLADEISNAGAEVVGVDSSPDMIAQARINFPRLRFVLVNAAEFSDPQPFDGVFSNAALHWMKPPEPIASVIARALRPGGRFLAEMGGFGNIAQVVGGLRAILGEGYVMSRNPWYYPTIGEYASLLQRHGLTVEKASLFDRPTRVKSLRDWLEMFAGAFFRDLTPTRRDRAFLEMESYLKPALYHDGDWCLDYRRLRIQALKPA